MVVNVRKMAAESGGVGGQAGGSKKGNRETVIVGLPWAVVGDEIAQE